MRPPNATGSVNLLPRLDDFEHAVKFAKPNARNRNEIIDCIGFIITLKSWTKTMQKFKARVG